MDGPSQRWRRTDGAVGCLKDWHCVRDARARGEPAPYETPAVFADDWLNAWWDRRAAGEGHDGGAGGAAAAAAAPDGSAAPTVRTVLPVDEGASQLHRDLAQLDNEINVLQKSLAVATSSLAAAK